MKSLVKSIVNTNTNTFVTIHFTALHAMQTQSIDEKAVCPSVDCPSVCLSNAYVDCDETEERSVQVFIPYDRAFSLVF